MSHTPGPWTHKKDHTDEGIPVYCIRDSRDEWVADTNAMRWVGEGVSLANARLVCAAPELLEALQGVLPFLEELSTLQMDTVGEVTRLEVSRQVVREAIRKALGQ